MFQVFLNRHEFNYAQCRFKIIRCPFVCMELLCHTVTCTGPLSNPCIFYGLPNPQVTGRSWKSRIPQDRAAGGVVDEVVCVFHQLELAHM